MDFLCDALRRTSYHVCGVPAKNVQLESNYEKTSDKPKLSALYKKMACYPKNVNVTKEKERLRNCNRLKES